MRWGNVRISMGRESAAWLGLVPRQYSTGGKVRLSGISKCADAYLRTLLLHGARALACVASKKADCNGSLPNPARTAS